MTTWLTDDEALALASLSGRPWPSVLPTVDVASPDEVARAIRSGTRSLAVRGLVTAPAEGELAGDFHADVRPLVAAIAEGRTVVVLQQAQCAPPHRAGGVVVLASHDAAASQTLLDVVSPAGVHEVAEAPADLAREALARQLRAAFDDGVRRDGEPEPDLALFVTVLTDGAARVDRVTRGKCETGGFEVVSGVPTFVAARGAATPDGALAVLAA